MPTKTSILSLIVLVIAIASCKKSLDNAVTPINNKDTAVTLIGTWTLTGINVTESTEFIGLPIGQMDSVKTIAADNYPMSSVTGSFVFTSDSLHVNGLSYAATFPLNETEYTWPGDVLVTSDSSTSNTALNSTNISFVYSSVPGGDSISFPQGGMPYQSVAVPMPLTPNGSSYTITGDTLKMNMSADSVVPAAIIASSGLIYFGANSHLVLTLVKQQ